MTSFARVGDVGGCSVHTFGLFRRGYSVGFDLTREVSGASSAWKRHLRRKRHFRMCFQWRKVCKSPTAAAVDTST